MIYHVLDVFFLVFHSGIIVFNLFGWIWKKTRRANLILLLLTAFSWFGLGIWYGWGYCFCTDWHWQVLHKLGRHDMPNSYITYLLQRLLPNLHIAQTLINFATVFLFFAALVLSVWLNVRDYRSKRKE